MPLPIAAVRGHQTPPAAAGMPSLLDDLIVYYKFEKVAGDWPAAGGSLPQTLTPSISDVQEQEFGKIGVCAQINDDGEYLVGSTGAFYDPLGFTVGVWVYMADTSQDYVIASQDELGNTTWKLWYDTSEGKFCFSVSEDGFAYYDVLAPAVTAFETWVLIIAWCDVAGGAVKIELNAGGSPSSNTFAGTPYAGNALFLVGSAEAGADQDNGRIDCLGIWARLLTLAERVAFYGAGAGLEYPFS